MGTGLVVLLIAVAVAFLGIVAWVWLAAATGDVDRMRLAWTALWLATAGTIGAFVVHVLLRAWEWA